jgi:hypothetical protein
MDDAKAEKQIARRCTSIESMTGVLHFYGMAINVASSGTWHWERGSFASTQRCSKFVAFVT